MLFRQMFDGGSSTYTYLLAAGPGREALLIDPVLEKLDHYLRVLKELDLRLTLALDTHVHADHISALGALRDKTRCVTVMGRHSKTDRVSMRVTDGDQVAIDGIELGVLYTPGHTDDSYCFTLPDRVFTGDTLLIRGTGRTDFQNGDPRTAWRSLQKLMKLPDETLIYPGHDYKGDTVSTIGEERRFNPRLRVADEAAYAALMNSLNLPNPKMMDVAVPANLALGLKQTAPEIAARTLDVDSAKARYNDPGVVFVDLREEQERARDGTVPGAVHVPYTRLERELAEGQLLRSLAGPMGKQLILFCAFGERSALALEALARHGIGEAHHLGGGMDAWIKQGGPYVLKSAGQDI